MIGQVCMALPETGISNRDIEKELAEPTDMRIFSIAQALESGISIDRIWEITKIDNGSCIS
jgi:carbamoyl-phosphate synthase large subunit